MPTYEYQCSACEELFEIFQSIKENPKRKCPKCGELKLKRLISAGGGFLFKGDGFYITDYRSSDYQKQAKAEKEGGSKSESGKSGSESKSSGDSSSGSSTSDSGGAKSGGDASSGGSSASSSSKGSKE